MYKLTLTDSIIRLSDNATIPADDRNKDYKNYILWLSDGNVPTPVDPLTYKELRGAAYPPITDQLDTIFHGGLEAWKVEIQAVKTKYPKV